MNKDLKRVKIVRYLRPKSNFTTHNLGGATFVFDLDYEQRKVSVFFAITPKDKNFNKQVGIDCAINSGVARTVPLDAMRSLADQEGGFVDAYWTMLNIEKHFPGNTLTQREKVLLKKVDYYSWR